MRSVLSRWKKHFIERLLFQISFKKFKLIFTLLLYSRYIAENEIWKEAFKKHFIWTNSTFSLSHGMSRYFHLIKILWKKKKWVHMLFIFSIIRKGRLIRSSYECRELDKFINILPTCLSILSFSALFATQ